MKKYTPSKVVESGNKYLEFDFDSWAEGNEARDELKKIPGAKMILERDGYDLEINNIGGAGKVTNGKAHLLVIVAA